ncbi:20454_t:CDS:2 [Dentiscutata erythropus]|uniref:20454_t:CDS:1 n=1 Tax=Dentiscutata erythropus TaxID=1348616 RepID=A0A9N9DLM4_9GLOM|nr:20454_t:CDS:2 [Dentiscutata erythropus]
MLSLSAYCFEVFICDSVVSVSTSSLLVVFSETVVVSHLFWCHRYWCVVAGIAIGVISHVILILSLLAYCFFEVFVCDSVASVSSVLKPPLL